MPSVEKSHLSDLQGHWRLWTQHKLLSKIPLNFKGAVELTRGRRVNDDGRTKEQSKVMSVLYCILRF